MRVAIYTLPKPPGALGGEDQMAIFMVEELASMGIDADIYLPHESHILKQQAYRYDCLISNNIGACSPVQPAAFWHFNESFDRWHQLKDMGYTHLFTNSADKDLKLMLAERTDLPTHHLSLAAPKRFVSMEVKNQIENGTVGYIGNFNDYKISAIEKWLTPMVETFGDKFKIWGGSAWNRTPFAPYYQGILPTESWNKIPTLAQHWINFRSEIQSAWGMVNDRVYWLLASGARYVHTDQGVDKDLPVMVSESPDIMILKIQSKHVWIRACDNTRYMICQSNLYQHRMVYMMHVMGARKVAKLGS